jgi:thiol-disulfide isomerase/thioredoxin
MRSFGFTLMKTALTGAVFVIIFSHFAAGQTRRPTAVTPQAAKVKVTQVDEVGFKKLLVPNGKPLLINFWATWCDPCREEFPELVELDHEYKGKIDFLTVSLDDPADIATTVPKFLGEMKAEMPAYLLKTADESTVIASVSKDWRGGMPFTALYSPDGKLAYFREGKVVMATMRAELNKLLEIR